jgi:putative peptide zinc metalloprotease protein
VTAQTTSTTPPAQTTPTATPADLVPADPTDTAVVEQVSGTAGGANVVQVRNQTDNRLRFRGKAEINHVFGPQMEAANLALAYASCTSCQTYAIALQIVLYDRTASVVAPQNAAVAFNAACSHCYTEARAVQYAIPVDDPSQVPDRVGQLAQQFDDQLRDIAQSSSALTAADVDARVDGVIAQFQDLAGNLLDRRSTQQDDAPLTPTPTSGTAGANEPATGTPTPTPVPTQVPVP